MPYLKVDTGILDSTIWVDREARDVFLTALLMAYPIDTTEPLAQIEVRSLNETGFIVPPAKDTYGFIEAAGEGICRRALVDIEAGLKALERLGSPEVGSRSPDYEGRRLIRVAGGYLALNYGKYRDRDGTIKERQRRFRQRKRNAVTGDSNGVTPHHNGVTSVTVTQAVSSKQEALSKKQINNTTTTARKSAWTDPEHKKAFLALRQLAPVPEAFDALIRTIHKPTTGGKAFEWNIIGAALVEFRSANGEKVPTAQALRAYCRRLVEPEAPPRKNGKPDIETVFEKIRLEEQARVRTDHD